MLIDHATYFTTRGFPTWLSVSNVNLPMQCGILRGFTQGCLYVIIRGLYHEQLKLTMTILSHSGSLEV